MTRQALYLLWAIEERLVASGRALEPRDARTAELVAGGLLEQGSTGDSWGLTPRGWQVAHAFRRFRAEHAVELQVSVGEPIPQLPDFEPPDDVADVAAIARDAFQRAIAAAAEGDQAATADRCIAAARVFVARKRMAGL